MEGVEEEEAAKTSKNSGGRAMARKALALAPGQKLSCGNLCGRRRARMTLINGGERRQNGHPQKGRNQIGGGEIVANGEEKVGEKTEAGDYAVGGQMVREETHFLLQKCYGQVR